jgi:hypothetical protein
MIFKSTDEFSYLKDSDKIIRKIRDLNVCLQELGFETKPSPWDNLTLENNKLSFSLILSVQIGVQ